MEDNNVIDQENENVEEVVEPVLPDHSEEIEEIQKSINDLIENVNSVSGIDEFIVDNSNLIINVFEIIYFYAFVGVPLFVIVLLFWTVYKQFLYTNI